MEEKTGVLCLEVLQKGSQTIPGELYYQGALKLMRPQYLDETGQVTFFILNPGGGYVDGDRYEIVVHVKEGADLYLTTQSATKIYETPKDKVCQKTKIMLAKNSSLVYIPDTVIPYENSVYQQEQEVHMSKDAFYFASEILTPGWTIKGEGFFYKELNMCTHIYVEEELVVSDRIYFTPQVQQLERMGMLEGYSHLGSVTVLEKTITPEMLARLREFLQRFDECVYFGVSELEVPGFTMRILGNSTQEIEQLIYACYDFVRLACKGKEVTRIRKF